MTIQKCFSKILSLSLLALFCGNLWAEIPNSNPSSPSDYGLSNHFQLHHTTTTSTTTPFTFTAPNKFGQIKPFIAPSLLLASGTALHYSHNLQQNFQKWVQNNGNYTGHAADYLPYAPLAAVYSLNALGIKGKNNIGNRTALIAKSYVLNAALVKALKHFIHAQRPNNESQSFPSGHTSVAFAMAHFMHKEYGERNSWYSIGAYTCATSVGVLRILKNAHYLGDVLAGAGIGILSTELSYLTHLYKFDKQHLKNFHLLPFQVHKQKGLTLLYNF